ncbi:hypothetical protein CEUSTIGMA_g9941.t1 [Chlamydomonas eustigma]|uniref:Citrate transporter-like domain-containing protein n=1 Tax=Chlamydomonas eustigma TaxID=1157962 RepID=A0A250XHG5_9CHLO|nr:hypothetical protein CEUSTIGMA_g9941.t1 [Chlamydomonas eustigma]|eukprot:GAX82514.1 hypothetical protein CEUSTIGMA_g9941.t1 [Chlamydomonas eustigma]
MLLFFAGMFVMVEGAVELGLMRKIAALITLIVQSVPEGNPQKIAAIEVLLRFSAIFSSVLDNIPYTIAMIPVMQQMANESNLDITMLTWALAFGACLGGNGTLTTASANIVTAGLSAKEGHDPIGFMAWLYSGVPVTIATVAIDNVYLLLLYAI